MFLGDHGVGDGQDAALPLLLRLECSFDFAQLANGLLLAYFVLLGTEVRLGAVVEGLLLGSAFHFLVIGC